MSPSRKELKQVKSLSNTGASLRGKVNVAHGIEINSRIDDLTQDEADKLNIPLGNKKHVEVDLKEFGITAYQPKSSTTIRIDFHLYATVNLEDQDEFNELIIQNTHRLREQIIVTARSVDANDLTDPSLGLLKRKILEKTNRILGKPLVKSVVFSDYSFVSQ